MKLRAQAVILGALLTLAPARADVVFLPKSRHHRFLSFALLSDEHCGLLIRNASRAVADVGAAVSILEIGELNAQLTVFTHVQISLRQKAALGSYTAETTDGRLGAALESTVAEGAHLSLGFVHTSGHVVDGTLDSDLLGPNLGDDSLFLRGILDRGDFRFGATLRPVLDADPSMVWLGADQFVEWLPLGEQGTPRTMHPYVAFGLEEAGVDRLRPSYHLQIGVFAGSHRGEDRLTTVRFAVGYYHGADPRLKYARLRDARISFPYLGALLNL